MSFGLPKPTYFFIRSVKETMHVSFSLIQRLLSYCYRLAALHPNDCLPCSLCFRKTKKKILLIMFMSLSLTLKLAHISLKNSIFSLLHQIFTIVKRFLFLVEDFSDYLHLFNLATSCPRNQGLNETAFQIHCTKSNLMKNGI